ncbi:unnamed protein product [Didymodactylos carnosus]|uniref:Uncharacterized protein n=1 Tax=Didymodactylos carnosus TaxID=1234261 RepID=A0A814MQC9_9BILA|nr:unnamed protein product [Didymodactylos carnosus]CAF1081760.1 unnamed protein product [Didymodactylos carnosus]CAF3744234.1 unnamed protein product [Didymodactylos carnosus]CAF3847522.1 unnamed protein product [Didymodactylos carnosus]
MNRASREEYIEQVIPKTRFGQSMAVLFHLKRHKKKDIFGRCPVVSRAQSSFLFGNRTLPFEISNTVMSMRSNADDSQMDNRVQ